MTFQQSVANVFRNYATFSGRAARSEFWWFTLLGAIMSVGLSILDGSGTLSGIWSLAVLLPSLAVGARRLHDTDRSGWWQLLVLIPLIGAIILIVWYATKGSLGANRFGPDAPTS